MKTERDGKIIHDNGFVQDAKTGRILAPSRQHFITDSARGRELARNRHAMTRAAYAEGIYRELIEDGELPSMDDVTIAQALELGKMHARAMKDPRTLTRFPEFVRAWAELTDATPSTVERRREGENPYGPAAELVGQITELMKLLKDNPPQPETVEGEAKTIEE